MLCPLLEMYILLFEDSIHILSVQGPQKVSVRDLETISCECKHLEGRSPACRLAFPVREAGGPASVVTHSQDT